MNLVCLALTLMTAATAAAQTAGNGDGASFSTVDNEIDSWWGLGIKSLCTGCTSYNGTGPYNGYGIVFDARAASIYTQGSIGIGTISPQAPLNVTAGNVSGNYQTYNALLVSPGGGTAYGGNGSSILFGSVTNHGILPVGGIWSALGSGGDGGVNYDGALVLGTVHQGSATPTEHMRVDPLGNVGIGTTTPGATLEVNGNIKLSANSGASIRFSDGTVQSTAWSGTLCGGDYAESVDITGERAQYEPGDVLVIDPDHPGRFIKASERYSTSVAGIYSTKPGLIGRRQTTDPKLASTEVPMAMVGVVPTKVGAENGPIRPGDLLVTSSSSGRAMKGTDRTMFAGAIVGKAMGSLDSGTGVIEVLVSLQ